MFLLTASRNPPRCTAIRAETLARARACSFHRGEFRKAISVAHLEVSSNAPWFRALPLHPRQTHYFSSALTALRCCIDLHGHAPVIGANLIPSLQNGSFKRPFIREYTHTQARTPHARTRAHTHARTHIAMLLFLIFENVRTINKTIAPIWLFRSDFTIIVCFVIF